MLEETVPVSYGTSRTRLIIPCWERGWFYWLDRTVKINWSDLNHSFNPTNICRYIVENMSSGNYDKIFTTIWNWSFELLFFFGSLKCWYLLIVQTFSLFDGYCIYFFKQIIMSCHIYLILYSLLIFLVYHHIFVSKYYQDNIRSNVIQRSSSTFDFYVVLRRSALCRSLYLVYRCRYICASPWWPSMGNGVNEQSRRSFCWMKARSSVYYTLLYTYVHTHIIVDDRKSMHEFVWNRYESFQ